MRYAVATGRAQMDPTASLRGALPPIKTKKHMAAPTSSKQVAEILRGFEAFKGTLQVGIALRLLPLLFCRPGELRQMKWSELDLDKAEWKFVASKTNVDHLVPLATQAVALIRELEPLTGKGEYVFAGRPGRPISDAAINAALRRMGYDTQKEITGHGWRAVARTLLAEELGFRPEVIEHQLAHAVPDALGKAYNRTKYIEDVSGRQSLWTMASSWPIQRWCWRRERRHDAFLCWTGGQATRFPCGPHPMRWLCVNSWHPLRAWWYSAEASSALKLRPQPVLWASVSL